MGWIKIKDKLNCWDEERHYKVLVACWLATVFSSFFGTTLFSFQISAIGHIFPFRILLLATSLVYTLWVIRGKDSFLKESSVLEKWVYLFIVIMLLYGVLSVPRAIDIIWTFRKLFNLSIDMLFFFLALRLCRRKKIFRYTMYVCAMGMAIVCVMGIYEVFFGGIFYHTYDSRKWFLLFGEHFQSPMVTFANTNDYCMSLCFFSAIFLMIQTESRTVKNTQKYFLVVLFAVVYFLAQAAFARLCIAVCWILFLAFSVSTLIARKSAGWICLTVLVLWMGVHFANQYENIVSHAVDVVGVKLNSTTLEDNTFSKVARSNVEKLCCLDRFDTEDVLPENTWQQELALCDENAEKSLLQVQYLKDRKENGRFGQTVSESDNGRLQLMLHAISCFVDSYGLGVGLGNAETLAPDNINISGWEYTSQYSIHCFILRVIADYGIFALIPLCIIAYLLLSKLWKLFLIGWREKDAIMIAKAIMFSACVLIYPIASTASSEAQDSIPMWIYLAVVVTLINRVELSVNRTNDKSMRLAGDSMMDH